MCRWERENFVLSFRSEALQLTFPLSTDKYPSIRRASFTLLRFKLATCSALLISDTPMPRWCGRHTKEVHFCRNM
jgi:hypothetical protein